jgi:hypothetical protein
MARYTHPEHVKQESAMSATTEYTVSFLGYQAYVVVRKNGRQTIYAMLDFITRGITIQASDGSVSALTLADLEVSLRILPGCAKQLRDGLQAHGGELSRDTGCTSPRLDDHEVQPFEKIEDRDREIEGSGRRVALAVDLFQGRSGAQHGRQEVLPESPIMEARHPCGSIVLIRPNTDVNAVIREVTERFAQVKRILEEAEVIGSRIKRRPYSLFIGEMKTTGSSHIELYGHGAFVNGKLIFHPDHQIIIVKQGSDGSDEVNSLGPLQGAKRRKLH